MPQPEPSIPDDKPMSAAPAMDPEFAPYCATFAATLDEGAVLRRFILE